MNRIVGLLGPKSVKYDAPKRGQLSPSESLVVEDLDDDAGDSPRISPQLSPRRMNVGGMLRGLTRAMTMKSTAMERLGSSDTNGTRCSPSQEKSLKSIGGFGRFMQTAARRKSFVPAAVPSKVDPGRTQQECPLLSSYLLGDLDLLEVCLEILFLEYGERTFGQVSCGFKIGLEDWVSGLERIKIEGHLETRFGACADGSPSGKSTCQKKRVYKAKGAVRTALDRTFGLLFQLTLGPQFAIKGKALPKKKELTRTDFVAATDLVRQAQVCCRRLTRESPLAPWPPVREPELSSADVLEGPPSVQLGRCAARSAQENSYHEAGEYLQAFSIYCVLEPRIAVREVMVVKYPAARFLGFIIRKTSRDIILAGEKSVCPGMLATLMSSLALCTNITMVSGQLVHHPPPKKPGVTSRLMKRGAYHGQAHPAPGHGQARPSETTAAPPPRSTVLSLVYPKTALFALAPIMVLRNEHTLSKLLDFTWGFLDESAVPEAKRVRPLLEDLSRVLGFDPPPPRHHEDAAPQFSPRMSQLRKTADPPQVLGDFLPQDKPRQSTSGPNVVSVCRALIELEAAICKKGQAVRCAALYGAPYLVHKAYQLLVGSAPRACQPGEKTNPDALPGIVPGKERAATQEIQAGGKAAKQLFEAMKSQLASLFAEGVQRAPRGRRRNVNSTEEAKAREVESQMAAPSEEMWYELLRLINSEEGGEGGADEEAESDSGSSEPSIEDLPRERAADIY